MKLKDFIVETETKHILIEGKSYSLIETFGFDTLMESVGSITCSGPASTVFKMANAKAMAKGLELSLVNSTESNPNSGDRGLIIKTAKDLYAGLAEIFNTQNKSSNMEAMVRLVNKGGEYAKYAAGATGLSAIAKELKKIEITNTSLENDCSLIKLVMSASNTAFGSVMSDEDNLNSIPAA